MRLHSSADFLRRCLRLARRGRYRTSPNPQVGAVVVREGDVVGEGWHAQVGGAHAEVMALEQAGELARGADVFVNLEPCAHHGRTPPCAEALLAAGVRRVVACHADPDPRTAGKGFAMLRRGGVDVQIIQISQISESLQLVSAALSLNLPFVISALAGRPSVTLKWAMSLDGRIATASGESQWISGAASRRWALDQRELHDAILVGSGTAIADDPRLNRRLGRAPGPILRGVLDRRLRLSPTARLFEVEGPVLVYTAEASREDLSAAGLASDTGSSWPGSTVDSLVAAGAEVVRLPSVEPATVLADLHSRGCKSVLVEGGGEVLASFVEAGLFDRVEVVIAPLLIGGQSAPGPLGGAGVEALQDALRLDSPRFRRRGTDLLYSGMRSGCLADLSKSVADF